MLDASIHVKLVSTPCDFLQPFIAEKNRSSFCLCKYPLKFYFASGIVSQESSVSSTQSRHSRIYKFMN